MERGQPNPLVELTMMRIRTFLREPEALFWTFGFPILMAIGLGIAFREQPEDRAVVAVERGSVAERWVPALRKSAGLEIHVLPRDSSELALRKGTAGVVLGGQGTLNAKFDPTRPESRLARLLVDAALQSAAGAHRAVEVKETPQSQGGSRYIDWVIPGLLGLNLMSTGMWGMGFGLVQMRQKKQLKRLSSTPMRKRDFLAAQILGRLLFLCLEIPPIVLFAWLAFKVEVAGSLLSLVIVVLLGAITFAGLGLLCAARARTIEGISGIINVVMLPMFVLSGVFFSSSRFPPAVQPLIRLLPLTALNDAMRAIYNDGAPLSGAAVPILVLVAWCAFSFAVALRCFRWQ